MNAHGKKWNPTTQNNINNRIKKTPFSHFAYYYWWQCTNVCRYAQKQFWLSHAIELMRTQNWKSIENSFGINTPKRDGLGERDSEWIAAFDGPQWGLLDTITSSQNLLLIIIKRPVRKWQWHWDFLEDKQQLKSSMSKMGTVFQQHQRV